MLKSTRSLKAELSACLRQVQNGEECFVSSYNKIIAKIIPVQEPIDIAILSRKNLAEDLTLHLVPQSEKMTPSSQLIIKSRRKERY